MNLRVVNGTARLVELARNSMAPLHEQHGAFTRLIEESQGGVVGLALSLLGDMDEAKDAAQEAFTTAWLRLRQLRDPSAFVSWLKTIVAHECTHRLRSRALRLEATELPSAVEGGSHRIDYQALVAAALATLSEGERQVTVLYYFLGYSQVQIARHLRLLPGTVAKRLHSARLRIRRRLPASVRGDFVRLSPSQPFIEKVRRGLLDDYAGEYRFERRPDQLVTIIREGGSLVSEAAGQRNLLVPGAGDSLLTRHYDGEGRFRRNRQGRITHFVYYEHGKRLGIARRTH